MSAVQGTIINVVGGILEKAQTPTDQAAVVIGAITGAIAKPVVEEVAKAVMRDNVEVSSETSPLDPLCPPDS